MLASAKLIATFFGIGYLQKGSGTVAAFIYAFLWYVLAISAWSIALQLILISILFFAGVWASGIVEKEWGKDNNKVVIDEVSGMSITFFIIPDHWLLLLIGFIVFRFFDIVKPFYIRKAESFPSGWGVMADDLLAGMYSFVLLQFIVKATDLI